MPPEPVSGASSAAPPWHRVSPAATVDFIVVAVRQGLFQALPALAVLVASAASSDDIRLAWILRALGMAGVAGIGWAVLSWLRFGYRVRDDRVEVRKGVLHREILEVEFDRIQNVSLQEPFYYRPFGLAVIGIDTAGSNAREIRLPGIPRVQAQALRERLIAEARDADSSRDEENTADDDTDRVLLRLSRRDVVIAGLTNNFMLWAAVAIGTVFGSGETAEQSVAWLIQHFELREVADAIRAEGGDLLLALAITGAVFFVLLLLPVISVVGALFRYDGYTLRLDGDRFRRTSGLASRHDESLRQHKIQAVTWKQNAIALMLRRINLQLRQASAGTAPDGGIQLGGGGRQPFMVPSLDRAEAVGLTGRFLPGCDVAAARFTRVDPRRYIVVSAAWILVPSGAAFLAIGALVDGRFALAWMAIALVVVLVITRCWRQAGWAVSGDHGLLRKGFIGSNTSVFPLFKVQRMDIVQTPWLRRRGLAHLTVHLASHSMTLPWMRTDDAERFRDLALQRAESSEEAWL